MKTASLFYIIIFLLCLWLAEIPRPRTEPNDSSDNGESLTASPPGNSVASLSLSLFFFFFFFFFKVFGRTWGILKFLGQGLNLRHSYNLHGSCSNTGSFIPLYQARDQIWASAYVSSQARGQIGTTAAGLHHSHSRVFNLRHSSRNAGSPTEWDRGWNPNPHGYLSDLFLLHHNGNSLFVFSASPS